MFFDSGFSLTDLFGDDLFDGDLFEPVSDYLSGYTSANIANRFYAENMEKQQEYNRENMQKEQDYNLENMAKTDDYQRSLMSDSPSLQVAALRRAGLNPLLAVGNGISSAQTVVHASNPKSAAPSASMPNVSPQLSIGDVAQGVSSFAGLAKLGSDIALTNAQTSAQKAQAAASSASAFKQLQEAHAIDPALEKEVKARGKSWLGSLSHDILSMFNPRYDATSDSANSADSVVSPDVKKVSSTSAQGLADGVKTIVERLPRMRREMGLPPPEKSKKPKRRHN